MSFRGGRTLKYEKHILSKRIQKSKAHPRGATEYGCELSGDQATAMKHGAVTWTEDGSPVFIETLPNIEVSHD